MLNALMNLRKADTEHGYDRIDVTVWNLVLVVRFVKIAKSRGAG